MGIRSEKSTYRIITRDRHAYTSDVATRDEALKCLLAFTKDLDYREAVIVDFNTGSEVVSLRTIK